MATHNALQTFPRNLRYVYVISSSLQVQKMKGRELK